MSRKRDYAAEYKRRIDRLTAEGFTKAQARGHAKTKTISDGKGGTKKIHVEKNVKLAHLRERIVEARRKAFGGDVPKRERGESKEKYEHRLQEIRAAQAFEDLYTSADFGDDRDYDDDRDVDYETPGWEGWDDFDTFMDEMLAEGMTEHEAYDLWFGY